MGIMDMFSQKPVAPAPVAPTNPQQQAVNNNPAVPNATNTPVIPSASTENAIASPLEGFADLWQTPDPSTKAQNTPLFTMDPKKLQEAASKINFGQVISKEALAAIAAGGEGAVTAFQDSITKVAQATFAQSTATTAKLIEQAMTRNNSDMDSRIPDLIKKQTVSELNRAENPLFSNPATAPIMSALEQQFTAKYPNATAAQIQEHTRNYLEEFITLANSPKAAKEAATKSKGEPDWSQFLG